MIGIEPRAGTQESRERIDELIAAGESGEAERALASLWRNEKQASTAAFVVSRFARIREELSLRSWRLAILRSFTVEPAIPLLRACAFTAGFDLEVRAGDFNAYAQEILDPGSWLYGYRPDAAILAVQTADIAPELWAGYADLDATRRQASIERVLGQFRDWMRAFRAHTTATLIVHTLEMPPAPANGLLDAQSPDGQAAAIASINGELRRAAREIPGVYVLDYDGLVARHGRARWRDERKSLAARMPIAAANLVLLAEEWTRFLYPMGGRLAKAVVVDLDNTLWGGIAGEDGFTGIRLGPEYPGAAFQAAQRALLDLRHRGILLAIASKNNPADAIEILERHPGMLLRPTHFAAMRINWNDKAQSLREIAAELNIGADALAFVDDNPVERDRVRAALPEAIVVELPADPMGYAAAIRAHPAFERLALSGEDRRRAEYYQAERQRRALQQNLPSKEDFYRSLEQVAEVEAPRPETIARIAQLTQKTNQFNLTTRRYTEQQIAALAACPNWKVFSIRVCDRFADNGLVGVAIAHVEGEACEIDTFLLSCRVIGRTVETALLAAVLDWARSRGARAARGWFLPTAKNAPARDFYAMHGFQAAGQNEQGCLWETELASNRVSCPEWIRMTNKFAEGG